MRPGYFAHLVDGKWVEEQFKGFFSLEDGEQYVFSGWISNCHICGGVFSPLSVIIIPTSVKNYFLGTYCRGVYVAFLSGELPCNCVPPTGYFTLGDGNKVPYTFTAAYDPKDNMQGKRIDEVSNL
jgi:hypothetical protein